MFETSAINHPFHITASVLTAGLWLAVYGAIALGRVMRPWRCSHCGWHKPEFRVPYTQLLRQACSKAGRVSDDEARARQLLGKS
jgi:hypothetical protein